MTHTTYTAARSADRLDPRRLGLVLLGAVVANLIVFGIGSAAGATWAVNGQTVGWVMVVLATVIAMAAGGLITFAAARRWARARSVLAWAGLAFAVVSAPAPLLTSDDATTGWSLAMMHVLTGIAWFVAVRPQRTSSTS